MKLPDKIHGYNKLRDAQIIQAWGIEAQSTEDIAETFQISQRRVEQILIKNKVYVPLDKEWEKRKRIHRLQQEVKTKPHSKKDLLDVLEALRKEIEGDTPLIDQSQHQHLTIKVETIDRDSRERNNVQIARSTDGRLERT